MLLFLFLILIYFFKIYVLGELFYIDDENSYINIAVSDGAIISLCVLLFYFSKYSSPWLSNLVKIIISWLAIFYVIDLVVIFMFNARLYFDDLDKFYINIDFKLFNLSLLFIMLIFLISIVMFFIEKNRYDKKFNKYTLILIPLMFLSFNYDVNSSVRSSFFKNYINKIY